MEDFMLTTDYAAKVGGADGIFCSLTAKTEEERVRLYNIMNSPEKRVSDMINMEIRVTDVVVETVDVGGEEKEGLAPRVILIDEEGIAYQCVSMGIYSAIRRVISIFGAPHWDTPKTFVVRQIKKDNNSVLTLEMK